MMIPFWNSLDHRLPPRERQIPTAGGVLRRLVPAPGGELAEDDGAAARFAQWRNHDADLDAAESGGEKHMVVRGTFIFECQGQRVVMNSGSFSYIPARMVDRAWTVPDEDCLLYTDVDRA